MSDWGYFVNRLDQLAGGFALASVLDELDAAIRCATEDQIAAMPRADLAHALGKAATRTNDPHAISWCLIVARDLDEMIAREYARRTLPVVVGGLKSHASSLITLLNTLRTPYRTAPSLEIGKNLKVAERILAEDGVIVPW